MKGKGKALSVDKDCPLQFPDLQPVDHVKQCTKYTAVLGRSEDDGIGADELDTMQTDLETLLASAGKRLRQLENEIQILVNWQEKKDIKKGTTQPETPTSGKRGKVATSEDKPSKKFKDSSGKSATSTPTGPGRPKSAKSKNAQVKVQEYDFVESPQVDLPKLPKNDAVNRFWTSVEPYCGEISNDDVKLLEDLLLAHDDNLDLFVVPALGKHYSEQWMEEDLLEEQRDGAKINDRRRGTNNSAILNSGDATTLLKKAEQINAEDSPFGPLTQRLVSALIEENIMTPIDDVMTEITGGKDSSDEAPAISPRALAKQLNIGNPNHLERRIKRELEEHGLLDMDEVVADNPDDEILTELRQKQAELKTLAQYNGHITKKLYKFAKEEMSKQEIRKKLSAVDAEVMEAYRKIQVARQKKKTPTKKERDSVWKLIKEREMIVKALDM